MTLIKQTFLKITIILGFLGLYTLASPKVLADDFSVAAKHAFAIETSTGKILYAQDANTPAAIASTTKLLTIYLVYQEISQGKLSWETPVAISDYAYDLTGNYELSNVPMDARSYTVKELVDASLLTSSNSAAIALAEHISGSEPSFVDRMTAQLKDWGITDAKLVNATGLNNKYLGNHLYPGSSKDDENTMSAKSLALVAYHLIQDYPDVLTITSQPTGYFSGLTLTNSNAMLADRPRYRAGVDGLKTGTSERSGESFVATATVNRMRVITVVLNAKTSNKDDSYARFDATNTLLDYIANTFEPLTILAAGEETGQAPIQDGKKATATAIAQTDLIAITSKTITNEEPLKTTFENDLTAPIKTSQSLGTVTYQDNHLIDDGYIDSPPSVPIVAKDTVETSFFLKLWWNHFVRYVNEKL